MKKNDVMILSEDATCAVLCECGKEPFISDSKVYRCECGRGYRTEFVVFSYETGETDENFADSPHINTPEFHENAMRMLDARD